VIRMLRNTEQNPQTTPEACKDGNTSRTQSKGEISDAARHQQKSQTTLEACDEADDTSQTLTVRAGVRYGCCVTPSRIPKRRRKLARMATLHERSQREKFRIRRDTDKNPKRHWKLVIMLMTLHKHSPRSRAPAGTGRNAVPMAVYDLSGIAGAAVVPLKFMIT
jgi:hypothetical protein